MEGEKVDSFGLRFAFSFNLNPKHIVLLFKN